MNVLVERVMYVTLLLVFIGVIVSIYALISFGSKLDRELKASANLAKKQQQTIEQIQGAVSQVENSSSQNTVYLRCLINLRRGGNTLTVDDCAAVEPSGVASLPSSSPSPVGEPPVEPSRTTPSSSSSPQTAQSSTQNNPQQPSSYQQMLNLLKTITGIGL